MNYRDPAFICSECLKKHASPKSVWSNATKRLVASLVLLGMCLIIAVVASALTIYFDDRSACKSAISALLGFGTIIALVPIGGQWISEID
jgi:hypothetical protein